MKAGMFVFFTGLLVTFGAVGGIEQSVESFAFYSSLIVGAVGLAVMWAGTKMINRANNG
jgi:hypothetical protein